MSPHLFKSGLRTSFWAAVRKGGVLALIGSASACGGNLLTREVGVADVTDQSTVKVEGDRSNGAACDGTLFVDWSEGTSTAIADASKSGLVVVKVKGCKLEVLPNCHADGAYDFVAVTPTRDRTEVSSDNAIAIGVLTKDDKRLGAEAGMGKAHTIEYAIVGQEVAKSTPSALKGECAGATHYASAISVGAYELSSSEHSEVSAIVKLHEHKGEERHGAGDVDRCSKRDATSDDSCKAPLKLDLNRAPMASQ